MRLKIIDRRPDEGIAHPDFGKHSREQCTMCALAVRPDTGEIVLLWLCGGINWGVSRNMPDYRRHRRDLQKFL